ncbi:hypothetical protein PAESOLCIP111_00140 [Paenibacillus solanacearum]|uniref:Uncharacterized protein n=1 Tax=Paenibacillus solanacearum TaxID=2048548 RepID=A0A916JTN6_9BACL|nr:hypothetical protein PAESOLCIP111_00140 [Paenibacillus solanacearum]
MYPEEYKGAANKKTGPVPEKYREAPSKITSLK